MAYSPEQQDFLEFLALSNMEIHDENTDKHIEKLNEYRHAKCQTLTIKKAYKCWLIMRLEIEGKKRKP